MAKLSDMEIRNWIKSNERFDMRGDGDGLYLSYREAFALGLPDKVLIEQFKQMLESRRKPLLKVGISIENKLRPDFEGWAKFGVLPYLDLNTWAELEGLTIPNRVMADAIFPVGEGGEEVVRKTTEKIAKEILTKSHLNKLAALAAQEIAERNVV